MMISHTLTQIGFLLLGLMLGLILGIFAVKYLIRFTQQGQVGRGKCSNCDQEGFLVTCKICGCQVAMCHYYGVLYPDDPGYKFTRLRRSTQVCTKCIPVSSRESIEKL
jgi:hypothetical protein